MHVGCIYIPMYIRHYCPGKTVTTIRVDVLFWFSIKPHDPRFSRFLTIHSHHRQQRYRRRPQTTHPEYSGMMQCSCNDRLKPATSGALTVKRTSRLH